MSSTIEVQYAVPRESLPVPTQIKAWARAVLRGRRKNTGLVVRIVDNEESARLNQAYRGKQGSTNVLSFPFDPPSGVRLPKPHLGDLVICAPCVRAEAVEQGKPEADHWAHLVVHGVLHLLGHDHQSDAEARRMENREREILAELGIPDPYGEP